MTVNQHRGLLGMGRASSEMAKGQDDHLWALAYAERAALAEDLSGLTADQWGHDTLCGQWDVEEVVAHLTAAASLNRWRWMRSMLGARVRVDVHNQRRMIEHRGATPAETLDRFRLWTFEFDLPITIEWSNATAQAQDALSLVQRSPRNDHGTVPPHPCVVHTAGSVGPLSAPYRECTIWTPIGHLVEFIASGLGAQGGLVYTDRPSASFEDECARHLIGRWWMFAPSTDSNGDPGSCYIGYTFAGGG
jgi:hypothetical protein